MTNIFSFAKKQYKMFAEEVNAEAEYLGLSRSSSLRSIPKLNRL